MLENFTVTCFLFFLARWAQETLCSKPVQVLYTESLESTNHTGISESANNTMIDELRSFNIPSIHHDIAGYAYNLWYLSRKRLYGTYRQL